MPRASLVSPTITDGARHDILHRNAERLLGRHLEFA
jgi:hypothetical protein